MKKLSTLFLSMLFCTLVMAQAPTGVIKKAAVAPVVDGTMDAVWFNANTYNIAVPFKSETPTLGDAGTTTWKALWTDEGMYVLITVNDDEWYPAYMNNASDNWMYDKPEIYFNVNAELKGGGGGHGGGAAGKYQVAPGATEDGIRGTNVADGDGEHAFNVTEPKWVAEYFVPFTRFKDATGADFDVNRPMGFDITLCDGESAAPGVRQRANWANAGAIDESWNNMDDAGVVTFSQEIAEPATMVMKASTAPVIDGVVDAVWSSSNVFNIEVPFKAELPTVGDPGQTTWKALHNADGMYILVQVTDDEWLPSWAIDPPGASYMYDQLEVYFDCNTDKKDGVGGQDKPNGHLQIAPGSSADKIDGGLQVGQRLGLDYTYSYKVTGTNWLCELFVPWEMIKDIDGNLFDVNTQMGFDITVIDRDAGDTDRKRMNWTNAGGIDENWNNMDDAGLISFDGAVEIVYVEKVTVSGGTTITTDNGSLQFSAAVLPVDATSQKVKWSVENLTGKAKISKEGLLTAVKDGTVKVTGTSIDGTMIENSLTVTISGQKLSLDEINIVKNGNFELGTDGKQDWGGPGTVTDSWYNVDCTLKNEIWENMFGQGSLPIADDSTPYIFKFKAVASADMTIPVLFEDRSNNNNKQLTTTSPVWDGEYGKFDVPITTEAKWFTFDVIFSSWVENTKYELNFQLGKNEGILSLDSIQLFTEAEYKLLIDGVNSLSKVNKVQVFPNPVQSELKVSRIAKANSLVSVYSAVGQKIMEKVANGTEVRFNVANLHKGMYFVRFSDGTSEKFIKQ